MHRPGISIIAGLLALAAVCAQTYIVQNGTIMTVTKGTFVGSVVVKDGKISEVDPKVTEPAGATIIDATGAFVTPGIIDCHPHIAIEGGTNEGSVSDSSMVNIRDVIDPEDISIYRAMAGGVTTANILHGSANAVGRREDALGQGCGGDGLRRRVTRPQVRAG